MRLVPPDLSSSASSPPPPSPLRRRRRSRRRIPPSPSSSSLPEPDNHYRHSDSEQDDITEDDDDEDNFPPSSYASPSLPPPPAAYVNVAPLPVFRGLPDECPVAHLTRFERVCRANNAVAVDTVLRIFPVTLDGEAALWYDLTVESHSMSWPDIKAAFLDAYLPPESADESRSELVAIKQGETEMANAYYIRMRWILKKWPEHGMPEAVLKGIFVDGLRGEVREWVVQREPETVEEAARLARAWERAARRRRKEAAEMKCGFCDGRHEERVCEVRRRMKEIWLRSKEGLATAASVPAGDSREVRALTPAPSMGRRSECKCWKHQCWKRLERSSSMVTDESNTNHGGNAE